MSEPLSDRVHLLQIGCVSANVIGGNPGADNGTDRLRESDIELTHRVEVKFLILRANALEWRWSRKRVTSTLTTEKMMTRARMDMSLWYGITYKHICTITGKRVT